jgi:hypothetical protein
MRARSFLLASLLAAGFAAAAAPVDNCATVLGSISKELHWARALPPGRKTTYSCAKRYTALLGASRERILRSLGTPDASAEDGTWSYFFAGRYSPRDAGTPELQFRFEGDAVSTVDCRRTR